MHDDFIANERSTPARRWPAAEGAYVEGMRTRSTMRSADDGYEARP